MYIDMMCFNYGQHYLIQASYNIKCHFVFSLFQDEQSKGTGDSDGSVNNIRLFNCDKNNGMIVHIGHITLVPPKRPFRRPKKRAPSTPSLSSENNFLTNGSQTSDQYTNDLVSRTESELSFTDDMTSADTVPLVDLQLNDRVEWPSDHGPETGTVRWIGCLPDEGLQGEILVGVEFVSKMIYITHLTLKALLICLSLTHHSKISRNHAKQKLFCSERLCNPIIIVRLDCGISRHQRSVCCAVKYGK